MIGEKCSQHLFSIISLESVDHHSWLMGQFWAWKTWRDTPKLVEELEGHVMFPLNSLSCFKDAMEELESFFI